MFNLETMKLFFAMLTVAANIAVIGYVAIALSARISPAGADLRDRVHGLLQGYELAFAGIAATTATLGSLYLSEIAHLIPCTLCWYQRIAMYPLALLLVIAAIRRDNSIRVYSVWLAVIGAVIAAYHYVIQWFPNLEGTSCTTAVPCTGVWFREFGFASIPYMALSTFLLVLVLLAVHRANTPTDSP